MRRPIFIRAATNTCLRAMKSSNIWIQQPRKYNDLLSALLMTADNLYSGRPSSEDPDGSAAWGTIDTSTILLGFTLLDEVAAHRGEDFFNLPDGAAGALQRIVLHYKALNILAAEPKSTERWLQEQAEHYRSIDESYADSLARAVNLEDREQQPNQEFSYAPLWPVVPVPDKDPQPLILMDGFCGHRTKYSTCSTCGPEWLRQYKESLEKRRAWEQRQEDERIRSGRAKTEAEKLLNERRAELCGLRDCSYPHVRSFKKGDYCVTDDGLKVWVYSGEPDSDPQLPYNWKLTPSPLKNGFKDAIEIQEWNEKTGRRDVLGRQIVEP